MKDKPTVIDLFCGSGGLTLGFKRADYRVILGLDVDWDAIRTYTFNNPEIAWVNKDIRKVTVEEILDTAGIERGGVDLVVAGIPCEGYSLLNRRYDPSDPRNYLFVEFMRVVKFLRPKAALIENVPGLLRRENESFRRIIEEDMRKLGFNVRSFTLDAANYGVPQKRERLFFIGTTSREKFEPPRPTHGSPTSLCALVDEDVGSCAKPYVTVWDAISDLPHLMPGEEKRSYESEPKTEYQKLMREGSVRLYNHRAPKHPEWTVERIRKTKPGEPLYETFKQRIRLRWDDLSPTIPAGGVRPQWFFAHPEQPRGLTVRETARLQSFPDTYVFCGPLIKQRVLVGDAVPPLLAEALARELRGYL
ncbi:DNA cytosine methyltransferase [Infirmifilum sp.]|uniref:DNA cytosine methyltransferase n=1 Tax=Infirmifilum sp. TaxID=2856575 RepID=UPI003D0D965B